MQRIAKLVFLAFVLVLIQGCEKPEKKSVGKFGMLSENTPEYAAMMFFDALYKQPTLDAALVYSSDRMAKMITAYHTPRNVQRHLINLPYDEVTVEPETGDNIGRNEFAEKARVTLYFTGMYNGDKVDDLREVDMIREGRKWKVDNIRADKFL